MVQRLGCCIPHHVQMFFWLIYRDSVHRNSGSISLTDVSRIYETDMLGIRGHGELSHYEERLRMVIGKDMSALAFHLLTVAAVKGQLTVQDAHRVNAENKIPGWRPDEALVEVLGILEHDGYLVLQKDGTYAFISLLIRDRWKARFGSILLPMEV